MLNKQLAVHENRSQTINWAFGAVLLCLWIGLTFQGLVSAVKIWYISEIFNHCFFVLPVSLYLIWEKKNDINWRARECTLLALPLIFLQVLLYVIGVAGDIQLFQHAAMFSLLPTLIWFYLGNRITKQIIFPLSFMLFAIPFGEELIPFLQEITADISVEMVSWTGVPLYRSGLFLEIPQGRFLVAEACSGVSFLIASVVLGNLYAYMNLKRMTTRVGFVLLSIIFPILANAVRVFGIIMIGYASDMKHAVGADHLIYGWFFFAFVILCLLGIGEVIRRFEKRFLLNDKLDVSETTLLNAKVGFETPKMTILWSFVVIVFLLAGITKSVSIQSDSSTMPVEPSVSLPFDLVADGNSISNWEPAFKNPSSTTLKTMRNDSLSFVYFQAYYSGASDDASSSNGVAGELVSAQNDIFLESKWSISGTGSKQLDSDLRYQFIELSSSFSQKIMVYHLYVIDGQLFTDVKKAKLYQVWLKLQGKPFDGMFIAVSVDSADAADSKINSVLEQISQQAKLAFEVR